MRIAIDGKEALQAAEGPTKVDIVFVDMMMLEMDGYERSAVTAIRNGSYLPVNVTASNGVNREKCVYIQAEKYPIIFPNR